MSGTVAPGLDGALAVVVARGGRLPAGADVAASEAGGAALVVGSGAAAAAAALSGSRRAWWCETGPGFAPGALAHRLAHLLVDLELVVLPASPDGRDLAPRLAAAMDRPLVAGATRAAVVRHGGSGGRPTVHATVSRLDDRVLVPVEVGGPAVVTLVPGARGAPTETAAPCELVELDVPATDLAPLHAPAEAELIALLEPDPHTMDLADATSVLCGGAGLAAGADDREASRRFALLADVAAAIGASAGATRVATDAGWTGYERQIGTTGVVIDPDLYVAFGVSGATQHVGGLGTPRQVVSVNTDPACPMTAMADLGLVTDAAALLAELARRFGLDGSGGSEAGDRVRTTESRRG